MKIDVIRIYNYTVLAPAVLQRVCMFINDGLEHSLGELDLEHVLKAVLENNTQLWVVHRDYEVIGAFTTEIIDYPNVAVLRIITLAGDDFSDWIELAHAELVRFARENKAKRLDLVGRKGWIKRLAPLGFREAYSVVVKEIA